MLESLRLERRMSEIRQRLRVIAAMETSDVTEEIDAEERRLAAELNGSETRYRAALLAEAVETPAPESADTAEGRELRRNLERADAARYFAEAAYDIPIDGVEAELRQHYQLGPHTIPTALLREPAPGWPTLGLPREMAVTPIPAETGQTQRPIVQPVFAQGDTAYLRIPQVMVASGSAAFPVLTSRPTVGGPHTDSTSVAETTGAFTADSLDPGRLQASFFFRKTDAAKFAGMDAALRMALSEGLSESLDVQMIAALVTGVSRVTTSTADTYATYRSRLLYGNVDGRYARTAADLRLLVGDDSYADMAATYRADESEATALSTLMAESGGVRVSPHIAVAASNKRDAFVRRGGRPDAVVALWAGTELLRDPYSRSDSGEVKITGTTIAAFDVQRADGFRRVQVQHS